MSSVAVVRRAFGRIAAFRFDIDVDRLLVRALKAAAPGPCRALVNAGLDAGLDWREAVDRASTCFLAFSAFNLSDDLSDDDCDYIRPGPAQGVVLILNGLFVASLRDLHLPSDVDAQVCRDLIAAEQAQVLESSTESWDAPRLWVVTDGIAGRQWSAYLRIMWSGTPLEHLSSFVAEHIGRVALLAGDITTADPRYNTLPPADKQSVLEEALARVTALESVDTQLTKSLIAQCQPVLLQQLTTLSVSQTAPSQMNT